MRSPRFIEAVKKVMVRALRETFNDNYPDEELRNINVSIDYPSRETEYPGIWVRFSPTTLQIIGVGSRQYNSSHQEYREWYFEGRATWQTFSMTSLQRDRISDALIYLYAFGELTPFTKKFGDYINNNDMIYISLNTDALIPGGQEENVGAPWQPDAIVYGDSYSFNVVGQFQSDFASEELLVLEKVELAPSLPQNLINNPPFE
jgi:hypothetical protein